jgi:hypothetical protein
MPKLCLLWTVILVCCADPRSVKAAPSVPFLAHRTTQFLGDGAAPASSFHSTLARTADGSWAHSYEVRYDPQREDGATRTVLEFVDVSRLVTVHVEPVTQSITTRHFSIADLPTEAGAGFPACEGSENAPGLERATMLGFDVVRLSSRDGGDSEVKWVAPALDCYPLWSLFTAWNGRQVLEIVTDIEVGPPPANLFSPPPGYVERSPRQIQSLYSQRFPDSTYLPNDVLELVERRYHALSTPH